MPGPSRENRFSAHGAIGDLIQAPPGANQLQQQQSNLGVAPVSNGNESLWGPLSKQSSSSSFWGGHQVEADPVPESVQVSRKLLCSRRNITLPVATLMLRGEWNLKSTHVLLYPPKTITIFSWDVTFFSSNGTGTSCWRLGPKLRPSGASYT